MNEPNIAFTLLGWDFGNKNKPDFGGDRNSPYTPSILNIGCPLSSKTSAGLCTLLLRRISLVHFQKPSRIVSLMDKKRCILTCPFLGNTSELVTPHFHYFTFVAIVLSLAFSTICSSCQAKMDRLIEKEGEIGRPAS